MRRRLGPLLLLLSATLVAGCADDRGERGRSAASESPEATPEALCGVVTDDMVRDIIGLDRPLDDPIGFSDHWLCDISIDLGDPLEASWEIWSDKSSVDDVDQTAPIPMTPRSRTTIAGAEVRQVVGRFAGRTSAEQVVLLASGHVLFTRVATSSKTADTADLVRRATIITRAYLTRSDYVVPPLKKD